MDAAIVIFALAIVALVIGNMLKQQFPLMPMTISHNGENHSDEAKVIDATVITATA